MFKIEDNIATIVCPYCGDVTVGPTPLEQMPNEQDWDLPDELYCYECDNYFARPAELDRFLRRKRMESNEPVGPKLQKVLDYFLENLKEYIEDRQGVDWSDSGLRDQLVEDALSDQGPSLPLDSIYELFVENEWMGMLTVDTSSHPDNYPDGIANHAAAMVFEKHLKEWWDSHVEKLHEYEVVWNIPIFGAKGPLDAARRARAIQILDDTPALTFTVYDEDGREYNFDLGREQDNA